MGSSLVATSSNLQQKQPYLRVVRGASGQIRIVQVVYLQCGGGVPCSVGVQVHYLHASFCLRG